MKKIKHSNNKKLNPLFLSITVALSLPSFHTLAQEDVTEIISVTGSRIQRIGAESPSPITVINSAQIRASGAVNIAELLNKLPSMAPGLSNASSNSNGNAGISAQDLRGQGAKRTLTLVNGRRHVGSIPGESTVDMSSIPVALIERIEILTGGASSIYGADAVAGVVNIITKKDFEGTEVTAFGGMSDRDDAENHGFNITHGLNFDNDRGNVTFHATYDKSGNARARDRSFADSGLGYIKNPADPDKSIDGVPDAILNESYRLINARTATVMIEGKPYTFNDDGSMRSVKIGTDGALREEDLTYTNTGPGGEQLGLYYSQLVQVPVERALFNTTFNYELSDDISFFTDLKYSQSKSSTENGPARATYAVATPDNTLHRDNAFIGNDLGTLMDAGGLTSLPYAKQFLDLGQTGKSHKRELYQIVSALKGTLLDNWDWETYVQYGVSSADNTDNNDVYQAKWEASLDSVRDSSGNAVCRESLTNADFSDCVPLNIFQPATQEVRDYILVDHTSTHEQKQFVAHANISGEVYELPAGALAISTGIEYRKEESETDPSFILDTGIGGGYATEKPVLGEYSVREAFVEFSIPVFADVFLAKQLDFTVSGRLTDYSEAGSSTSWNLGSVWQPIEDIKFRVSRSKSARAPNINEQFTTVSTQKNWAYQPCNYWNIKNETDLVVQNCRDLGVNVTASNNANYKYTSDIPWAVLVDMNESGNKNLTIETANTLTVGLVLTPRFIDDLSITFDYWDIKLEDMIDSFEATTLQRGCVTQTSLDTAFCRAIEREDNGLITAINMQTLNLNERRTEGLDMDIAYKIDSADIGLASIGGEFRVSSLWQKLLRRDIQTDPTVELESTVGLFAYPEWKGNIGLSYTNDDLSINWTSRYIGPQKKLLKDTAETHDKHEAESIWYSDVSFTYHVNDSVSVGIGANNIFDQGTPQMPNADIGGASYYLGYEGGLYDTIGRSYFANVNYKF